MHIIVTTVQVPFIYGGAEALAHGLIEALRSRGHRADLIGIPFISEPPERFLDTLLTCRLLDLEGLPRKADLMIGLKFPAYLLRHPNKRLWIIHQHRQAYDLWGHPLGGLDRHPNGRDVRDTISRADRNLIPEARQIFTISKTVSSRLQRYCGIQSTPLYPPVAEAEKYHTAEAESYFFFPSRLSAVKRQELVLTALTRTRNPVAVCFAGGPDGTPYGDQLQRLTLRLRVADRVRWLGHVSDEEKRELYARSLAVIFPPIDEDYGYVTLEAMLSSKPVITCEDSGGTLEFVRHRENGLIVKPDPTALAEAMDELWENRDQARAWGAYGRDCQEKLKIKWPQVVDTLLQ